MEELFIQTPQFEKVAYKRVSENPSEWIANVMEAFYNQFPSFSNSKVSVNFTQKDEAKGYAIGNISIEEGTGMVVPIIIKDRELYPFDVALVNGNAMPLSNATIQMYIENRGAFWKLVKPDAGDITNALFNTSFSQSITPTYMHETYKQASVSNTLKENELAEQFDYDVLHKTMSEHLFGDKNFTSRDIYEQAKKKQGSKINPKNQISFLAYMKGWNTPFNTEAEFKERVFKKQAEYNTTMSMQEDMRRTELKESLGNQITSTPTADNVTITGMVKGKTPLPQDLMLKRMQEQALMGGQMKANELFLQMKRDHSVRGSDSLLYMMLCFKKWAGENGLKNTGWDIPGFEKTSSVADWFFDEDVNFLAQHSGITRTKLNEAKQKDNERFTKLYLAAKKAKESGGDIRAALSISMAQGGPQPLTDKTEQEAGKVAPNMEPALGVTPFSKTGSEGFISKIAPTITSEMKETFFDVLQKDASVVEGFKANNTAGLILKIAAVSPQSINFIEKVRQEIERDIHYIYKSAAHEYTGIFGNAKIADPVRITLNDDAASQIERIKVSPAVDDSNEQTKTASCKYLFEAEGRKYAVLADNNYIEFKHGTVFPGDEKSFFKPAESRLDIAEPSVTKNAMWKIGDIFTSPFEVLRVWSENGQERIETFTGLEKKAYCRLKGIDEPYEEHGIIYLPIDVKFVKLGNLVEIPEKIIDNPLLNNEIIKTADNQYLLQGRVFSELLKKEGGIQDLHGTIWNMIQCGARKDDIEKVASMIIGDRLPLKYDLRVPHSLEKIASIMESRYTHDADTIIDVAKNFIKEAAAFSDPQTVDMVLSLNFVNKNNILEFVEALPMFAQVSQKLADMLLKARLGVTLIEESAIRRTMLGMVEIMDVLNGVQNLLEKK